jgi:hypothetical protein
LQSEWVAGLIAIRTAAVGRAMEVPQVILRAIDGQVGTQAAEILGISDVCGAFIRPSPQINPK